MSYSDGFTAVADAALDDAHTGDIHGAFGTIRRHDVGPRSGWGARLRTLLAILGPGLIVMVGDNDAGAFGTYAQAGQNYGTTLLWTLLLLVPVLYVNQEMVLRLGAVTRVGHARLYGPGASPCHITSGVTPGPITVARYLVPAPGG